MAHLTVIYDPGRYARGSGDLVGAGFKAEHHGIDGPAGDVLAWTRDTIVVKVPGHNYWSGRGMQSYAQPTINVYRIDEWLDETTSRAALKVTALTGWDAGRNKSPVTFPERPAEPTLNTCTECGTTIPTAFDWGVGSGESERHYCYPCVRSNGGVPAQMCGEESEAEVEAFAAVQPAGSGA